MQAREWKAAAQELDKEADRFVDALGAVVKKRRKKLGLEPRDLANIAQISLETVVSVEAGKAKMIDGTSISKMYRIARALGISARKLIEEAEDFPERNGYQEPRQPPLVGLVRKYGP